MPANLELKARLASLAAAERVAASLGRFVAELSQVDTYFAIPADRGRLKLREIDGAESELIAYVRPDEMGFRRSDFQRVPLTPPTGESLKQALTAALGVMQVVRKRRRLYLAGDVRIHLDQVEGLGDFLEFEALLGQPAERLDERSAARRLEELAAEFGIAPADRIGVSYCDLRGQESA